MTVLPIVVGDMDTNCYLVYDESARHGVIVDPGGDAQRIMAAVHRLQLAVTAVVLTHGHCDHMMAAEPVKQATGALLLAPLAEQELLEDASRNLSALFYPGRDIALTADRWLQAGDTLPVGGTVLTVLATPGHTPGGICLRGEGILLAGDTLFAGSIGRLDFPGGDEKAMHRSLTDLLTLPDDTVVYPGHGPATTIGRERHSNPYLYHL